MERKTVLNLSENRSGVPAFQVPSCRYTAIRGQPRQKGGCAYEAHNPGSYGGVTPGGDDGGRRSRLCAGGEEKGRGEEGREEGEGSPEERWYPCQSCPAELGRWRPTRRWRPGGR